MVVVNRSEFKILKKLNSGSYGYVYLVDFCGKIYCYKHFVASFSDDIGVINRLCSLTDMDFDKQFLVPLFMVENASGKAITGYLTEYNKDLLEIEDCFSRNERIKLLKSVRENLEILHNDFGIIHGDMHLGNILCDKANLTASIIDFDLCMRKGESPICYEDYTKAVKNYLKYYPFDEGVDIYKFNFATFKLLAKRNYVYDVAIETIKHNDFVFPEMNEDIKRLVKELTFQDIRKPYSKEYIIDYID